MATIGNDPNGRRRILFVAGDGTRKTIRLGKVTAKQAEAFKVKVENLIASTITGSMDDETARWLSALDDRMHARLVASGLARPRKANSTTLMQLLDAFFEHLNVKPITSLGYQSTRAGLLKHFGAERSIRGIEPLEAERWRGQMKADGLAEATISKRIGIAKHIFRRGVGWKLLAENPFADVKAGSQMNKDRQRFISAADAAKVLAACPDPQWQLLFALSRFGGLRCPSEHLALRWSDVDWEHGCIRVACSKTAHHQGRAERFCPIFPELRPYLLRAFEEAEPGTQYVITRYRQLNSNLRTQLERIIRRAGLSPWPRLFHNLRATRQTELTERFPAHVVAAWIGNTERVAQNHYLRLTDAHFAAALKEPPPSNDNRAGSAAQNPAQYPAETSGNEPNAVGAGTHKPSDLPTHSARYPLIHNDLIAATGLEPVTRGL